MGQRPNFWSEWDWRQLEAKSISIPHITRFEDKALRRCHHLLRQERREAALTVLTGVAAFMLMIFLPARFLQLGQSVLTRPLILFLAVGTGAAAMLILSVVVFRGSRRRRYEEVDRLRQSEYFQTAITKLSDMQRVARWLGEYGEDVDLLSNPPFTLVRMTKRLTPRRQTTAAQT